MFDRDIYVYLKALLKVFTANELMLDPRLLLHAIRHRFPLFWDIKLLKDLLNEQANCNSYSFLVYSTSYPKTILCASILVSNRSSKTITA